ncbi:hypothetical protein MPER_01172 [Moniliophthora perniciosa FA553]|nr:hypothetical protein MPER_01172 [Moniliophthora perniciosa FA553]
MNQPKGQIYADLLLPLKHGHPLWLPEPTKHSLPKEYQRQGVQIGDVGVITSDSGFEFLFNVCLPANHPINQFRGTPIKVRKYIGYPSRSTIAEV